MCGVRAAPAYAPAAAPSVWLSSRLPAAGGLLNAVPRRLGGSRCRQGLAAAAGAAARRCVRRASSACMALMAEQVLVAVLGCVRWREGWPASSCTVARLLARVRGFNCFPGDLGVATLWHQWFVRIEGLPGGSCGAGRLQCEPGPLAALMAAHIGGSFVPVRYRCCCRRKQADTGRLTNRAGDVMTLQVMAANATDSGL